jgi:hypothetical protein
MGICCAVVMVTIRVGPITPHGIVPEIRSFANIVSKSFDTPTNDRPETALIYAKRVLDNGAVVLNVLVDFVTNTDASNIQVPMGIDMLVNRLTGVVAVIVTVDEPLLYEYPIDGLDEITAGILSDGIMIELVVIVPAVVFNRMLPVAFVFVMVRLVASIASVLLFAVFVL